jgi:hypothetical protein
VWSSGPGCRCRSSSRSGRSGRRYWATAETAAGLELFTPALLDRLERDPGFYLETLPDRVLVAKSRPTQSGVSRLLTDDEVPAFLDEALELFRLVAVRRGWAPPPS